MIGPRIAKNAPNVARAGWADTIGMVASALHVAKLETKNTIGKLTAKNVPDAAQLGEMLTSGTVANVQHVARCVTRGMTGGRTARNAPVAVRSDRMLTRGLAVNALYAPLSSMTGARTARNAHDVAQFVMKVMIGVCNARGAVGAARLGRMLTRGLAAGVQLAA